VCKGERVLFSLSLQDYIFSILTGYCDPPAGIEVSDEMAYNPYFPGGVIGMPQQLFPDGVEYDDGKRGCGLQEVAWVWFGRRGRANSQIFLGGCELIA
jgi:hypothetical protein